MTVAHLSESYRSRDVLIGYDSKADDDCEGDGEVDEDICKAGVSEKPRQKIQVVTSQLTNDVEIGQDLGG